jgi:hypothetical protein
MKKELFIALFLVFLSISCLSQAQIEKEQGWQRLKSSSKYEFQVRGSFGINNEVGAIWAIFEEGDLTTLRVVKKSEIETLQASGWEIQDADFFNVLTRGKVHVLGIKKRWTSLLRNSLYDSPCLMVRR